MVHDHRQRPVKRRIEGIVVAIVVVIFTYPGFISNGCYSSLSYDNVKALVCMVFGKAIHFAKKKKKRKERKAISRCKP